MYPNWLASSNGRMEFSHSIQWRFVAIDRLRSCEASLRLHSRHKYKLKKRNNSIQTFGHMRPIVIDSENVVFEGHCFLKATRKVADEVAVATVATNINAGLRAPRARPTHVVGVIDNKAPLL